MSKRDNFIKKFIELHDLAEQLGINMICAYKSNADGGTLGLVGDDPVFAAVSDLLDWDNSTPKDIRKAIDSFTEAYAKRKLN